MLVSGNFNVHLDDSSDADPRKFMELMDTFGLLQHVTTPMHVSGHVLDLIISRSPNNINIFPPKSTNYISNHCFAECQFSLPGPHILAKEVSYCNLEQTDMDSQWTRIEELAQCYDNTLSQSWINTPL